MIEGNFIFSSTAKKRIFTFLGVGIVLLAIGIFLISRPNTGHGHEEHGTTAQVESHGDQTNAEHAHETPTVQNESPASKEPSKGEGHAEAAHDAHAPHWTLRLIKDLWLNNIFFTGIAVIGVFFVAFNYIAQAGWSAGIKRVPEAFGYYLPFGFLMAVILFGLFHHDLFHWTHDYLYNKLLADGSKNPHYDEIIDGKKGFLNMGFYWFRLIAYYSLWILVWFKLRSFSLKEDIDGGLDNHNKSIFWSALFLVIFGITSSTSAWDWVMSMDPHFFSTMFGWYVFASWFVSGLAVITFVVVLLREAGYLKNVNESHIHDLGKFLFAFSIFWTYIWFAQFMLIYYANIPEEAVYFVERLKSDVYSPIFFMNFIINFCFPFLVLMTRNAKRQTIILKIVCVAILFGHWMDFYIMMTPPLLKDAGGLDLNFLFVELGTAMIFGSIFTYALLTGLSKAPMIAKNHPMLEESVHHHIY
jgi:hypothetical protein